MNYQTSAHLHPDWDAHHSDVPTQGEVLFLFIGGSHQVFHLAPVAAAMARLYPDIQVTCLHRDAETGALLEEVRRSMSAWAMRIAPATPPSWSQSLGRILHIPSIEKVPLLRSIARRFRHARAVIVPERTSAHLRKLGMKNVPLIHFRHGAGDRAPKSEHRLKAFDLILVPGEKDVARAVEKHGIAPERLRQCGYVKLDYLAQQRNRSRPRLFADDRPVVLYNPHFDPAISSWPDARRVIEQFAGQDRYNLIFAPHIRISERLTAEEMAQWQALATPGSMIVDFRSPRMVDMSYALAADIYLGDVSSQLYEFLHKPRPVAFLNSHKVAWEGNPRYAGWQLGSVADDCNAIFSAIDEAVALQPEKAQRQIEAVARAFGDWNGAALRGARQVGEFLGLTDSASHHGEEAARLTA